MHSVVGNGSHTLREEDRNKSANRLLVVHWSVFPNSELQYFMVHVSVAAVKQPMNWSQTEGEPEGKTERTKPLRIKAAPLLTQSWLPSTTRSIFKHNIDCSVFPFRFASSRNHKAWIKTPLKSTAIRAAHTKQTRKHSQKRWLGLRNPRGCSLACVRSWPQVCAESLIKEAIIGDNWTEVLLLMSSRSASRPC